MSTIDEALSALHATGQVGRLTARRAVDAAERMFEGDVMKGMGFVEAASFAVYRGSPEQTEISLRKAAERWANEQAKNPLWCHVAALSMLGVDGGLKSIR